jgi:hypothetical protein
MVVARYRISNDRDNTRTGQGRLDVLIMASDAMMIGPQICSNNWSISARTSFGWRTLNLAPRDTFFSSSHHPAVFTGILRDVVMAVAIFYDVGRTAHGKPDACNDDFDIAETGVEWIDEKFDEANQLRQRLIDWRLEDVSRFALLLLGSALMLIVAACDVNGDDDAADDVPEDTTTAPVDDGVDDQNDALTDEDDDATRTQDAEVGDDPDSDAIPAEDDEDQVEGTETDDAATQDDEVAFDDDEAVVDPEDMEPEQDPNQGMFFDLSVEEANDLTEFEVREPEHVPEVLELQTIMGMASMEATAEENGEIEEEAATITFAYQQPPEEEMMQGLPVEFMQSTEIDMSEGLGPDAEQEQITVGDREVTRISLMAETGDEIIAYVWNEDEIHFSLAAILGGDLEESDLEEMIASVPAA